MNVCAGLFMQSTDTELFAQSVKSEDRRTTATWIPGDSGKTDAVTGGVEVVRYAAVDDNGNIINPMIVHGQVHGAIAQGLGQALLEHTVYDNDTGQLLSGSYMDYRIPRADDLPPLDVSNHVVPSTASDLGVKGAGRYCGTRPAIVNAVVDALKDIGIRHIDMPLTPERVWHAIRNAEASAAT